MPIDRPTFHESWHRVAELTPRLRATVNAYRQHFRGEKWYIIQDTASNQYFRLSEPAYRLIGLLDGRRTVQAAWSICLEALGDAAPTQGEVIELIGQLGSANLLQTPDPANTQHLFDRYRKRIRREVRSYVSNLLFVRIPLFNPDRLITRCLPWCGWWFSAAGAAVWVLLIAAGGYHLLGRGDELRAGASGVLSIENLALLYLCFAAVKALHELGHGIACKRLGEHAGGGEVPMLGVMLLIFTPVPYVDASSAWAFRGRWRRAIVGAAGVYVELAVAAVAAIIWARSADSSLIHVLSYNVLFIASVSTVLFNGNPLLRFDAYYVLSDLLDIPNLFGRSRDEFHHLIKRHVYGVRRSVSPASSVGDRATLLVYFFASTLYRVVLCISILLFIAGFFRVIAIVLGAMIIATWLIVPLLKWLGYLATSQDLVRTRGRATLASAVGVGSIIGASLLIPLPDRGRASGIVGPRAAAVVHAHEAGFIRHVRASGARVARGDLIAAIDNSPLASEAEQLAARGRALQLRHAQAQHEDIAVAQMYEAQRDVLDRRLSETRWRVSRLTVEAPANGVWVTERDAPLPGSYVRRGARLGLVVDPDDLIIRIPTSQDIGPRILGQLHVGDTIEMRLHGRSDIHFSGVVERILPAAQARSREGHDAHDQPFAAGRALHAADTSASFFEFHVAARGLPDDILLRSGQRVAARIDFGPQPLAHQAWRLLLQLFQRS